MQQLQHWLDQLEQALIDPNAVSLLVLMKRLLAAFAMGAWVAAVHYLTSRRGKRGADRSFLATLVLLSVLVALVTVVIGDNTARAFSLVGTLAIVRFRTVVEDTSDTAFVIYSVVSGMCVGSGFVIGPIACAPLVLAAAWILRPRREEPSPKGTLTLRMAPDQPPNDRLQTLLKQYLNGHRLTGVTMARNGTALEITYAVRLPAADQVLVLVNELSHLDGVQGVELKGS